MRVASLKTRGKAGPHSIIEAAGHHSRAARSVSGSAAAPAFVDRSARGAQLSALVQMMQTSPQVTAQLALNANLAAGATAVTQRVEGEEDELLQGKFAPVQRVEGEEEDLLQGKFAPVQRIEAEEEEPLQGKFAPTQRAGAEPAPRPNQTGLPDGLKSGIESLSGLSLDQVRVHYNSSRPAQLNAHAYAQGSEIHLAPGQEQHLPHEAWHVVQQAQGRVRPTLQLHGGVPVNDDTGLEREADVMGARAILAGNSRNQATLGPCVPGALTIQGTRHPKAFVQRRIRPPAAGAAVYTVRGRSGQQNTAANRIALQELRAHRDANPAPRHGNNPHENFVVNAMGNTAVGHGFHIAHHISDHNVQVTVANAANGHNGAWGPVMSLINGIDPAVAVLGAGAAAGGVAALPNFWPEAFNRHANAVAHHAVLSAQPVAAPPGLPLMLPAGPLATANTLTLLADSIANSPMNLHLGDGSTNMSVGSNADPNNTVVAGAVAGAPPALARTTTWRSQHQRNNAPAPGHFSTQARTLGEALGMGNASVGYQAALAFVVSAFPHRVADVMAWKAAGGGPFSLVLLGDAAFMNAVNNAVHTSGDGNIAHGPNPQFHIPN